MFSVGPGFFHYRPNFSALLNFAGPILKLFVWAIKRRPKTSPTYKIETLTRLLTGTAPASRQAGRPATGQPHGAQRLQQASCCFSSDARVQRAPSSCLLLAVLVPGHRQVQPSQRRSLAATTLRSGMSAASPPSISQPLLVLSRRRCLLSRAACCYYCHACLPRLAWVLTVVHSSLKLLHGVGLGQRLWSTHDWPSSRASCWCCYLGRERKGYGRCWYIFKCCWCDGVGSTW
jgi:hypothetical protein